MSKSRKQRPPWRMKRVPEDLSKLVDRYVEQASPRTNFEAALAHLVKRGLELEGFAEKKEASVAA
jgi:hypothetical protein